MARAQFEQALPYADVSPMVAERLSFPERAVIMSVPLRRDDGTLGDLRRLPRAALDRARADEGRHPLRPGGLARRVRRAREVDDVEVRAAAPAVRRREGRHPLRRPRALSQPELQRLTRRFTSELVEEIGPKTDIPAPDMATNEQTMAWMMDTYSMLDGPRRARGRDRASRSRSAAPSSAARRPARAS